jgi:hypothetical protein
MSEATYKPKPLYNFWTVQRLIDWCSEHGFNPADVELEYEGCGHHEIQLNVKDQAAKS